MLQHDFREYPSLLRQALSLARRLQEPLVEFAQLCNPDEDIISLKYHTLQVSYVFKYHVIIVTRMEISYY